MAQTGGKSAAQRAGAPQGAEGFAAQSVMALCMGSADGLWRHQIGARPGSAAPPGLEDLVGIRHPWLTPWATFSRPFHGLRLFTNLQLRTPARQLLRIAECYARSAGILPAVAGASRCPQRAGRMPTPQRAGRPRYENRASRYLAIRNQNPVLAARDLSRKSDTNR
jgi:hypothetical protein